MDVDTSTPAEQFASDSTPLLEPTHTPPSTDATAPTPAPNLTPMRKTEPTAITTPTATPTQEATLTPQAPDNKPASGPTLSSASVHPTDPTPIRTSTPAPTLRPTSSPTLEPAATSTPTPTPTVEPTPTSSPTPVSTATPGPTATSPSAGRPQYDPAGEDRNCGDFDTWRAAQDFFEAAGGPDEDRHRLDGDKDGIACEGLPGAPD